MRTGPVSTTYHISSPAYVWPWKSSIHTAHTHGTPTQAWKRESSCSRILNSAPRLLMAWQPLVPVAAPALEQRTPLDQEACGGLLPEIQWLWTRVDRERRKRLLPWHVSAVWAKEQAAALGPGPACVPGSSLCTPARLRDRTGLRNPGAPLHPSQADLGRRGRPVAAVAAAVRAGSSGPKHFTIALQNC